GNYRVSERGERMRFFSLGWAHRPLHRRITSPRYYYFAAPGTFQRIIFLSSPADARVFPSGLNVTENTDGCVCPLRVEIFWPLVASQIVTVLSAFPAAISLPLGLNATE